MVRTLLTDYTVERQFELGYVFIDTNGKEYVYGQIATSAHATKLTYAACTAGGPAIWDPINYQARFFAGITGENYLQGPMVIGLAAGAVTLYGFFQKRGVSAVVKKDASAFAIYEGIVFESHSHTQARLINNHTAGQAPRSAKIHGYVTDALATAGAATASVFLYGF
jgi:hypothetical protein